MTLIQLKQLFQMIIMNFHRILNWTLCKNWKDCNEKQIMEKVITKAISFIHNANEYWGKLSCLSKCRYKGWLICDLFNIRFGKLKFGEKYQHKYLRIKIGWFDLQIQINMRIASISWMIKCMNSFIVFAFDKLI